jgi:putative ABC transport system permease protein
MVVNALVAVTSGRVEEFRRLRLAGATVEQVRRSVLLEARLVGLVGIATGLLASLVSVVPYALARGEGLVPDGRLWVPGATALTAFALLTATATVAGRRATSRPAAGAAPCGRRQRRPAAAAAVAS